jgi:hypothetical protein
MKSRHEVFETTDVFWRKDYIGPKRTRRKWNLIKIHARPNRQALPIMHSFYTLTSVKKTDIHTLSLASFRLELHTFHFRPSFCVHSVIYVYRSDEPSSSLIGSLYS